MLSKLGLTHIRQNFENRAIADLPGAVVQELNAVWPKINIKPGETVAITAGSRGVANAALMTKTICDYLKDKGAKPFIVPAMGSHAGGTAEGQRDFIAHYGITEETMGVPINADMDVEHIGDTPQGMHVYMAKSALAADHILVFHRIKPHTDFRGDIESGLCKMMAIGLGKIAGATYYHRAITDLGFAEAITAAGDYIIKNTKITLGFAIVEDAHDNTALVKAVLPNEIIEEEKKLLVTARSWMARLPFMKLDCLVVDQIGKDISGAGMDTNIHGRFQNLYSDFNLPEPKIKRIYVRGLTPDSGGNATGMGRADFTNKRLADSIDYDITYLNCRTGYGMEHAKLPMVCPNDRLGLEYMFESIGLIPVENIRLVWIRDTLHLVEVLVSAGLLAECQNRPDITVKEKLDIDFDKDGWLPRLVI